jgi:hypothetical protein
MSNAAVQLDSSPESRMDTGPEANPWAQRQPLPTPDMQDVGTSLKSRVQRAVQVQQYGTEDVVMVAQRNGHLGSNEDRGTIITTSRIRDDINRKIRGAFPLVTPPPALSLQPLQEWEGHVTGISSDKFSARLTDVTAGKQVEEESAEFPIEDLSDDDRDLLEIGATFRWVIGYLRSSSGTKRRVSQITFRRLPTWTKADLDHATKRAEQLASEIVWE